MKKTYSEMKSCLFAAVSLAVLFAASYAYADSLPTDPWAAAEAQQTSTAPVQTGAIPVQQVGPVIYGSQPYQPTYEGGKNNVWNTKMPEFTGEMTTWGDSPNEKYNAPEVNIHNMISITQHLRNMGYKIPTSFENKIKNAPKNVQNRIFKAMGTMAGSRDPFSKGVQGALKTFEKETGLSAENLLGNSLNLLSAK